MSGFEVKGSLVLKEKLQYIDQIESLKKDLDQANE